MKKNIIIGAGISGLTTAYFSKKPVIVLEAKPYAGGLCASFKEDGFTFDCSGHFIHIKDEKIKKLVEKLSGGLTETVRRASIYINETFVPYPFQANLSYLDEKTKKECVDGVLKRKDIPVSPGMPFIEWSRAVFGKGITKHFMQPYNAKLWDYSLEKMTAQWTGPFVPKPEAKEIEKSAYSKSRKAYGYNASFFYPKENGCGALTDGLLKKIKPEYNNEAVEIDVKKKTVFTSSANKISYGSLVSTMPLPELVKRIKQAPQSVREAASKLECNSVRCVNLGIKSVNGVPSNLKNRHWIYIPEKKYPFYRLGVYSNVSKNAAPEGHYSIYVEFSSMKGVYKGAESVIKDLTAAELIGKRDEVKTVNIIDMPYAYVIFNNERSEALKIIKRYLEKHNIYSAGRYGAWEYSFIEKNIADAKLLARKL